MFWPLSKFQHFPHKIHCARLCTLTYVLHMVNQENSCILQLVPWFGWKWSLNLCRWSPSSLMGEWLLVKWLPFINLCAADSSWWASGSWKCSICSSRCGSEMSCVPFKTKQLFSLLQFYIIVVQNWNFDFGSGGGGIHMLVSTNRESEWKLVKFRYCPSTSWPVNHSIFRTKAYDKILL